MLPIVSPDVRDAYFGSLDRAFVGFTFIGKPPHHALTRALRPHSHAHVSSSPRPLLLSPPLLPSPPPSSCRRLVAQGAPLRPPANPQPRPRSRPRPRPRPRAIRGLAASRCHDARSQAGRRHRAVAPDGRDQPLGPPRRPCPPTRACRHRCVQVLRWPSLLPFGRRTRRGTPATNNFFVFSLFCSVPSCPVLFCHPCLSFAVLLSRVDETITRASGARTAVHVSLTSLVESVGF